MNCGCIYSSTVARTSCDNIKQDSLVEFDIVLEQSHSCIYPKGTRLSRSLFGVADDGYGLFLEFMLRLPTVMFESLYNVFACDYYVLRSSSDLRFSNLLFESISIEPNFSSGESVITLCNGKRIEIPYLCCRAEDYINLKKEGKRVDYKLLFSDSEGWLWFGGAMKHKRMFGICYDCSGVAGDIILFKVSCDTEEVVPLVTSVYFDQIKIDSMSGNLIEDQNKYHRTYWGHKGISRFLLQDHL